LPLRRLCEHPRSHPDRPQSELRRPIMDSFRYVRAHDKTEAVALARHAKTAQQGADIRYIAGGTTLVDLMKLDVERPQTLIDITHLPLSEVKAAPGGGVEMGAMVR